MPQSWVGCLKGDLDTPALCIDLDGLQANIRKISSMCAVHGVAWRPHAKGHKCPAIAHEQRLAGAIGATCAKLGEAEVLAQAGVRDLLVANLVVGERKWERVAALTRWADPIITVDHYVQAEGLSRVCRARGTKVRVIIEVDIGLDRVGVTPGRDTLELAQAIDRLPGLKLAGIMGYEGHLLKIPDLVEKERRIGEAIGTLVGCKDQLLAAGLCCDIVSCGGTGSLPWTVKCPGITEVQAGGGIFMDGMYSEKCQVEGLTHCLSVLATVVSRPKRSKAYIDLGRKSINAELGPARVKGFPDAEVRVQSAEHCELVLGPESERLAIGDRVEVFVGYHDWTVVLHDEFHGFRGDRLEVVWPILARGALQ